jgi:hypothetical protein
MTAKGVKNTTMTPRGSYTLVLLLLTKKKQGSRYNDRITFRFAFLSTTDERTRTPYTATNEEEDGSPPHPIARGVRVEPFPEAEFSWIVSGTGRAGDDDNHITWMNGHFHDLFRIDALLIVS